MSTSDRLIEYVHKKSTYVFPPGTKVFAVGEGIVAEIKRRKVRDFTPYIANKLYINKQYNYIFGLPITGIGSNLIKEYEAIDAYFKKYDKISFLQFDHATSHDIALCTFFKPMDFVKAGNLIAEITRSLPFLINIFRRPLIHLRQAEIIQPVDAVKRVNHNTIRHLTQHSENWKDIDYVHDEIVPSKLLTTVYEDDYSIYENVVFRDLIDNILTFLRKRIYYLTEILETFKESIQLDAVNRFNHQKYYLAIGKLYVGFYKMENSSEIQATLDTIKTLYKQISSYKNRAVYTKNAHMKPVAGDIKRTNILTMHKDYRHVFNLQSKFKQNSLESKELGDAAKQLLSQKNYERFCAMLIVFAVSNFNLDCPLDEVIFEKGTLSANFENGNWTMSLTSEYNEVLNFNIIVMSVKHKDNIHRFAIIPMSYYVTHDKKKIYEKIIERMYKSGGKVFDKYVFLEAFESMDKPIYSYSIKCSFGSDSTFYAVLPISVTEINSFRRIQKLVFEALVLTNTEYDVCAFCGEQVSQESKNHFICKKCKTGIKKITCKECKKEFVGTYLAIKKTKVQNQTSEDAMRAMPEFYKSEKQYMFRNIVAMNKDNYICPHCNAENGK